jgi:hypothetical protein
MELRFVDWNYKMSEIIWINDNSIKHLIFLREKDGSILSFSNSRSHGIGITNKEEAIAYSLSLKDNQKIIISTGTWFSFNNSAIEEERKVGMRKARLLLDMLEDFESFVQNNEVYKMTMTAIKYPSSTQNIDTLSQSTLELD